MKLILNLIILICVGILSILTIKYNNEISKINARKELEIKKALKLIEEIEGIQNLDLDSFLSKYEVKDKIVTSEATLYIFEYKGYELIYEEEH
ncbi:hypothetical protein OF820_00245 [Oceanotoga sp. DSM 15011]|uniref:hypothetical protein n=1 Tax=unclassified Oceanotoga TaxID=2618448 RepID=UPI0021F46B78|nr:MULTISPECIES: hypothetical protein [unclassified Oceanotoga]MDN5342911.1 hypothetical protein [Oceanotoga sp.]UYP00125.1 hypothetical protein OF820_00245 [Oceanotoga sp. DSM 15011]